MNVLSIVHGEDAGPELFGPLVAEAGHRRDDWSFESGSPPPLDAYDAVLVFGGFMHPDQDDLFPWLPDETDWLRGLVEQQVPTLGICLGSELLARATGAWVGRLPVPEIGWGEVELTEAGAADPVFSALPRAIRGLHLAPLRARPAGGRSRARAQRGLLAGVPAGRHLLGRAVPPGGDRAAARTAGSATRAIRRPIPSVCSPRRASGSAGGTSSGAASAARSSPRPSESSARGRLKRTGTTARRPSRRAWSIRRRASQRARARRGGRRRARTASSSSARRFRSWRWPSARA